MGYWRVTEKKKFINKSILYIKKKKSFSNYDTWLDLFSRVHHGTTSWRHRKHYENTPIQIYRKFHLQKPKFFRKKNSWYFSYFCSKHRLWVFVRTCGYSLEPPRRGGSNEYPQSMFLSRNKKNNVYPCKPQFYYIKVGFKGVKII